MDHFSSTAAKVVHEEKSKKNNFIEKERSAREKTERNPDSALSKQQRLLREKALKKPMMFESAHDHELMKGFKGERLMSPSINALRRRRQQNGSRRRFGRYSGGGEELFGLNYLIPACPSRSFVGDIGAGTSGTKSGDSNH